MGIDASTSNEGSKRRANYKEVTTQKVTKNKIEKDLKKLYGDFDLNCIAFDFKSPIKEINNTSSAASASSADTYKFDIEELEMNSIAWVQPHVITEDIAPKINKKRKAAEKKKKEKEKAIAESQYSTESNEIDFSDNNNNR